ncbi:hypothetical protein EPI10_028218 [Gossypium australe]|uniref:Uncharacterized protein n=1 Tax=Gossypium australe TaxID=47621 RepID=A0A5B6UY52_9ROSI|nr:hypothetical protein EPI10_028218 [Gossypium australe]
MVGKGDKIEKAKISSQIGSTAAETKIDKSKMGSIRMRYSFINGIEVGANGSKGERREGYYITKLFKQLYRHDDQIIRAAIKMALHGILRFSICKWEK